MEATERTMAGDPPRYTIATLASAPAFARGQIRDLRPRWALEEAGVAYAVRKVGWKELKSPEYRTCQPFNQVPSLEEEGRPPIFETGAMLVAIAERTGCLLPAERPARDRVMAWLFAGFSSIEPALANLVEVNVFLKDEAQKALRKPLVHAEAARRLALLDEAMGDETWLAGDFSIADIMMTTLLRTAERAGMLAERPKLAAYLARCEARPAFQRALAAQFTDTEEMKLG